MRIRRFIPVFAVLLLAGLIRYEVGADPTPCDTSLIEGSITDFTYSPTNEIHCKEQKEIVLNGQRYTKLLCDQSKGWIDSMNNNIVVNSDPSKSIVISCMLKACDERLVVGFDGAKMERIGTTIRCRGSGKALRIASGKISEAKDLKCFPHGNWLAGGIPTGVAGNESISVGNCFETECDEDKIRKGEGVTFIKGPPAMLSCGDNLFIVKDSKPFNHLKCDGKWKDETGEVVDEATASFAASCEEKACHPGLVTVGIGAERILDEIKCKSPNDEIKIDNEYYSLIACDKSKGWINETGGLIREADSKFEVNCVQKTCDRSLISAEETEVIFESGNPVKLKCTNSTKALLIGDYLYSELSCEKGGKWKEGSNEVNEHNFAADCVEKACHPRLLLYVPEDTVQNHAPYKLSCEDDSQELRVPDTHFYGSEFICDKSKGWIADGSELVVSEAESQIRVECVPKTCHESLLNTTDIAQFKFERDNVQIDKFILTCKDQDKILFVDNKHHSALECTKNGEWAALGRRANQSISVDCLAKVCAKSNIAFNDSKVVIQPRENESLIMQALCRDPNETLYVDGAFRDTVECEESEGWTDGYSTFSFSKSAKIVIDCMLNDDIGTAENISLIDAVTSCKESFEIDTKCDPAWKGCKEIALVDPNPSKCPPHLNMFYKQKDAVVFDGKQHQGIIRAALHCDRKRGWIVKWRNMTIVGINQGGAVICAEKNPLHVITAVNELEEEGRKVGIRTVASNDEIKSSDSLATEANNPQTSTVESSSPSSKSETDQSEPVASESKSSEQPANSTASVANGEITQARLIIIIVSSIVGAFILVFFAVVLYKICCFKQNRTERRDESSNKLIDRKSNVKREEKLGEKETMLGKDDN